MSTRISITAFTDGGARNNGKPNCTAAWATYFSDNEDLVPYNESGNILIDPSNQKAELYAIKKALGKLIAIVDSCSPVGAVRIITDSQYSIDCITKWCRNWEKN